MDAALGKSDKSAVTALLLCIFLGSLGIHRFYVGKVGTGILMLVTCGGFFIWTLVDLILIASGNFKDGAGRLLEFSRTPMPTVGRVLLILGAVLGGWFVYALTIVAIVFYVTSGITDTVRDQLRALHEGNFEKAYSYTSQDFQRTVSMDNFKKFVSEYPAFKDNADSTFTSREISNGQGTLKGTLTATDGTTTPVEYHLVQENGVWKILNVKVNPRDAGVQSDKPADKTSSNRTALPNVFDDKPARYSINYPADWEYTQPDKATVVIGGKQGTPSYDSTVNIQTILSKKAGGKYTSSKEFMDNMIKQANEQGSDTKVLAQDVIDLDATPDRVAMRGRYAVLRYKYQGSEFQQLQYIFESPNHQVFYAWAYTSTADRFEKDYDIAKAMFASWKVTQ